MNYTNELYHHGVKGMRWGVRRYQNEDGSLTEAGIRKYRSRDYAKTREMLWQANRDYDRTSRAESKFNKRLAKAQKLRDAGKVERAERITEKANRSFSKAKDRFNRETQKRVSELSKIMVRHGQDATERMLVKSVFSNAMVFDHNEQGGLVQVYTPDEALVQKYGRHASQLFDWSVAELSERSSR